MPRSLVFPDCMMSFFLGLFKMLTVLSSYDQSIVECVQLVNQLQVLASAWFIKIICKLAVSVSLIIIYNLAFDAEPVACKVTRVLSSISLGALWKRPCPWTWVLHLSNTKYVCPFFSEISVLAGWIVYQLKESHLFLSSHPNNKKQKDQDKSTVCYSCPLIWEACGFLELILDLRLCCVLASSKPICVTIRLQTLTLRFYLQNSRGLCTNLCCSRLFVCHSWSGADWNCTGNRNVCTN